MSSVNGSYLFINVVIFLLMMLYKVNADGRNNKSEENYYQLIESEEVIFEPQQTEINGPVHCVDNPRIIETEFNSVFAFVRNKMLLKYFSI